MKVCFSVSVYDKGDLNPAVITGNVRSPANKMDELEALARIWREYTEYSIMCFTESCLHKQIPDSNVTIPGFRTVQIRAPPAIRRK